MEHIFEQAGTDFTKYTFFALRPIIDSNLPTMTCHPGSRFTNSVQLRGGCHGRPSECLITYKFAHDDNCKWIAEWDAVYQDFDALRSYGMPLWYTGSDCTFRIRPDDVISATIAAHSKVQKHLGRPSKSTLIVDARFYEEASFATLNPMTVDQDADGQCGLLEWDEDITHVSISLGYNDKPETVARTFSIDEEEKAVDFFCSLSSIGLPLWYNGAEILSIVKNKKNLYDVIRQNI